LSKLARFRLTFPLPRWTEGGKSRSKTTQRMACKALFVGFEARAEVR
jgi:hypothetical protein